MGREVNVADEHKSFKAGIDFPSVLRIISKQIYETPLAFIRENVQNAVDAVRIQAYRDQMQSSDAGYRIDVTVEDRGIRVRDNGTGMSADDLRNFFWTIGASGKRTQEALAAGCVGTFGIGGFARGGDFNRKHANRIMRYRIAAQLVAVLLILLFVWLSRGG